MLLNYSENMINFNELKSDIDKYLFDNNLSIENLNIENCEELFRYMSSIKKYNNICFIIQSYLKEQYFMNKYYCKRELLTYLSDDEYFIQIFGEKTLDSNNPNIDKNEIYDIYYNLYESENYLKIVY